LGIEVADKDCGVGTEDTASVKTPIGQFSVRGPLVTGVVILFAGLGVLGYGIKIHNDATHDVILTVAFQQRVTNCLLTIPQESRHESWRLQNCLYMEGSAIPQVTQKK
jgi:hypothetical protein